MVLVSILGDFHSSILPIFFEFKEKITTHIILHDDSKHDLKQLNDILHGQAHFMTHYEDPESLQSLNYKLVSLKVNEDNYQSIMNVFERIKQTTTNYSDIYLNATDGLPSIGIVLASKLLPLGANVVVYDRFANTYNLHTHDSISKHFIKHNIDIKNHFTLKGYKMVRFTNKFELINRKKQVMQLGEDLQRLKHFANEYPNISTQYSDLLEIFNSITNIEDSQKKHFLTGVAFEEYIYWLLKDNFHCDDIMTGVVLEFDEHFSNEFDILMIRNNHLHVIECKFVSQLDGEHYVYKIDSTMDYLDDDGKGMILSIGGDEKVISAKKHKVRHQFTNGDQARAKHNDIFIHQSKIFHKEKFLHDVREWFCVQ